MLKKISTKNMITLNNLYHCHSSFNLFSDFLVFYFFKAYLIIFTILDILKKTIIKILFIWWDKLFLFESRNITLYVNLFNHFLLVNAYMCPITRKLTKKETLFDFSAKNLYHKTISYFRKHLRLIIAIN